MKNKFMKLLIACISITILVFNPLFIDMAFGEHWIKTASRTCHTLYGDREMNVQLGSYDPVKYNKCLERAEADDFGLHWRGPIFGIIILIIIGSVLALAFRTKKKPLAQQSTIYQGTSVTSSSDSSVVTEQDLDDNFTRFSPRDMEFLVGKLFEKKGYDVSVTQSTADRAIDVWAKNNSMGQLLGIEVKKHVANVGSRDVAASLGQGKSRANKVIVISTISDFTKEAYVILGENEFLLELWNGVKFRQEVSTHLLKNNMGTTGTLPKGY